MEGKENIFDELRLLSGLVAGISRVTPYALPDGYFESLADGIFLRIRTEGDVNLSGPLTGEPEFSVMGSPEPVYSVPTGYFEEFAAKLMDRIKAGQGQQTGKPEESGILSPLQESRILSPLEELADLSPFLGRIDKKMPFQVPEGYFGDITNRLSLIIESAQTIRSNEQEFAPENAGEESFSPLLAGLKNIPAYQAPAGYFDGLADRLLQRAKQQDKKEQMFPQVPIPAQPAPAIQQPVFAAQSAPAKMIPFSRRRTWLKYAAAAIVSGLMLTGGWMKWHNSGVTAPIDLTKSLSNVSDQEIESYLANQNAPLAEDLSNSTASVDITESDINNLLGDISDGELKEYVDEHGDAKDIATN